MGTNISVVIIAEFNYSPYGQVRWTNQGNINTDKSYTGQRDDGMGLADYNARYYAPYLNRFLSPDTIIPDQYNPLAWDRYAYARNNPIRYSDPSGHIPVCEGTGNCSDQWRQDNAYARLGEAGFMKYEIKYEFGVKMLDSNEMKWGIKNLKTAYESMKMINDKLQGNLKAMLSGTTFTIMGGGHQYYGWTGLTGVDYHVANSSTGLPQINFLHETGHLLDSVPATRDAFSGQIIGTPTWVKDGYVNSDLLGERFHEPIQAKPMNEPNQPGEYWADAFANYVADNIKLGLLDPTGEGQKMYDYVFGALNPYVNP